MTDTTGLDTLDAQRLELLRRRIAERGLARPGVDADAGADRSSVGRCLTVSAGCGSCSRSTPTARCSTSVSPIASPAASISTRLRQAVDAVALRHPVLRTTYQTDSDGDPQPVIRDDLRPGWAEHDLSGLAEQARRLRLEVLAQREFRQPFDLTKDSPLRVTAVRVAADELMLLLTAHHIAWDDGSWAPFFTDLTRAYTDPDSAAAVPAAVAADRRLGTPRRRPGLLALADDGSARAAGTSRSQRLGGPDHLACAARPRRGCPRRPSNGRRRWPGRPAPPRTWC